MSKRGRDIYERLSGLVVLYFILGCSILFWTCICSGHVLVLYGCVFLILLDMSYCMTYDFSFYVFDYLMSILILLACDSLLILYAFIYA